MQNLSVPLDFGKSFVLAVIVFFQTAPQFVKIARSENSDKLKQIILINKTCKENVKSSKNIQRNPKYKKKI